MSLFFTHGADLCQATQCKFLSLHRLFEMGRELFEDFQIGCESRCGVELGHANLADRAVTNEVTEAENVGYHCLEVGFAEHEGNELSNRCEKHHYVARALHLVKSFL